MAKSRKAPRKYGFDLFDVVVMKDDKVVRVHKERVPWYAIEFHVAMCKLRKGERCEVIKAENLHDYDVTIKQGSAQITLRCRGVDYCAGVSFVEALRDAGISAKLAGVR